MVHEMRAERGVAARVSAAVMVVIAAVLVAGGTAATRLRPTALAGQESVTPEE